MAMNHSMIEVIFKVCAELRHGEEVRISGNVPALGMNIVSRALAMSTSSTSFPWWQADPLFLPGGAGAVSYRYCIFSGGVFKRWEKSERQGHFHRELKRDGLDTLTHCTDDLLDRLVFDRNLRCVALVCFPPPSPLRPPPHFPIGIHFILLV